MTKTLGYENFVANGGDTGSGVTRYVASKYPDHAKGTHLTDVGIIRDLLDPKHSVSSSLQEQEYTKRAFDWLNNEAGCMKIQSTKPQTLAVGLSDSPVCLAAWLLEKFYSWRDLAPEITLDDIITNIMIYCFENNISTAVRI